MFLKNLKGRFHTDLDSQYTSQDFKNLALELNMIQSFIHKGWHYDNVCIESFHTTLNKEVVSQTTYVTLECPYSNTLKVSKIVKEFMVRLIILPLEEYEQLAR